MALVKTELVTTLKRRATEIIAELQAARDPVLIAQHGLPAAYLIDVGTFEEMNRKLSVLEGIALGEQAIREGRTASQAEAKKRLRRWLRSFGLSRRWFSSIQLPSTWRSTSRKPPRPSFSESSQSPINCSVFNRWVDQCPNSGTHSIGEYGFDPAGSIAEWMDMTFGFSMCAGLSSGSALKSLFRTNNRPNKASDPTPTSLGVTEKLSAIDTDRYLAARASKASVSKFRRVLSKVPTSAPDRGDEKSG